MFACLLKSDPAEHLEWYQADHSLKMTLQAHHGTTSNRVLNGYSIPASDRILLASVDAKRREISKQIKQRVVEILTQWLAHCDCREFTWAKTRWSTPPNCHHLLPSDLCDGVTGVGGWITKRTLGIFRQWQERA
jgi:hypothetical protein